MEPREILTATRQAISQYAGQDPDKWFYANRFVFARLQLDERRTKTQIKKDLLEAQATCAYDGCGLGFDGTGGVCLHRVDGRRAYSRENCVLMHSDCHQKYHAEHPDERRGGRPAGIGKAVPASPILRKVSKRYEEHSFLYWWDLSPRFLDRMERYEEVQFVRKDSNEYCCVPIPALRGYLSTERRTSRGQGNWGIRVLKGRERELAFEPGRGESTWLFLPVVWLSRSSED